MIQCKDCRHFQGQYIRGPVCKALTSDPFIDETTGIRMVTIAWARDARRYDGGCGPEARLFEHKSIIKRWKVRKEAASS